MKPKSTVSRLRGLLFWYPGGLIVKRIGHMIVIYSIGLNLYINHIQNQLFIESQGMINEAEALVNRFQTVSDAGLKAFNTINNFAFWSDNADMWWLSMATGGTKTAEEIQAYKKVVGQYSEQLKEYGNVYSAMSLLLKIISYLFWIRIAFSLIWILSDAIYGRVRRIMIFLLLLSIVFNVKVYQFFIEHLPISDLPQTLVKGFFGGMNFLEGLLSF